MYVRVVFMSLVKVLSDRLNKIKELIEIEEDKEGNLHIIKIKKEARRNRKKRREEIDLFAPPMKED
jgi:hypothetical protein